MLRRSISLVLVHHGRAGALIPLKIPLPKPRPEEAPKATDEAAPETDGKPSLDKPSPDKPSKPAEAAPPPEKQLSACRIALTEEIAVAPSIPDIHGPGACGGEDLVRLEAIVLPDKRKVAVKPAAILRCTMASAIANWVRADMVPLAASLGSTITDLDNFDSFECRGRNRIVGAMLSEHGKANALDVRALKLANGQSIGLTDRTMSRDVRERVLHSVCSRFSTVLGPGSDWYHEDHIHLDLAQRRNDYRICQWNVWDPLPQVAPAAAGRAPRGGAAARGRRQIRDDQGWAVTRRRPRIQKPSAAPLSPFRSGQQKSAGKPALFELLPESVSTASRRCRHPATQAANCRGNRRAWARAQPRWCRA